MRSLRARLWLAALVLLVGVGAVGWTLYSFSRGAEPVGPPTPSASLQAPPPATPFAVAPPVAAPAALASAGCADSAFAADAQANAASLAVVGAPGIDWAAYAPLVARETATGCPPQSPGFARALAAWRAAHGLTPPGGAMDAATFSALTGTWNLRRPFVRASAGGACPASPPEGELAIAAPQEGYGGKSAKLLPGALAAWRRMVAEARAQVPQVAADPRLLTLVSGFRGPLEEAARCALGGCDGHVRAHCSAHRTGAAVDLYLGDPATSAAPADRLAKSRTPAYRWLVANADRYGFVPYPFEPWHWEWTGGA